MSTTLVVRYESEILPVGAGPPYGASVERDDGSGKHLRFAGDGQGEWSVPAPEDLADYVTPLADQGAWPGCWRGSIDLPAGSGPVYARVHLLPSLALVGSGGPAAPEPDLAGTLRGTFSARIPHR